MRSSRTPGAPVAARHTVAGLLLSLSLLGLSEVAWSGDRIFIEFPGFERAEATLVKLGDGTQVQTGIAGRCDPAKETVIVEKEFGLPLSAALQNAVANGTSFEYVVVYRNNAQFWLHSAVITSYSVSGTVGGGPVESFVLEIADITVQPN